MSNHMGLARFKGVVRKGLTVPAQTIVQKALTVRIEAAGERRKLFTISTESVDRDNDTIALKGWKLEGFQRNPVVCYMHQTSMPPIGRAVETFVEGNALKSVVEFVPADMPDGVGERAEMVWRMCDLGFMHACSVGFRPLDYKVAKDRMSDEDYYPAIDFSSVELMEWSICTVPANADATIADEERAADMAALKAAEDARVSEELSTAMAALTVAAERDAQRKRLRAACY